MADHLIVGKTAENLALQYLQSQGLKLIAQNWQCHYGELDLIMTDNKTVRFVEVRYRKQQQWGTAAETITLQKRQKVIKTATLFLQNNHQFSVKPCQFDVLAITGTLENPEITWLPNAFSLA